VTPLEGTVVVLEKENRMVCLLLTLALAQSPDVEALKKENNALKAEVAALKNNVVRGVVEKAELLKNQDPKTKKWYPTQTMLITLRENPKKVLRYYFVGDLTFFGGIPQIGVDPANTVKLMTEYHTAIKLSYGNRETGEPVFLQIDKPDNYKSTWENLKKTQEKMEDGVKVVPSERKSKPEPLSLNGPADR
jgi:hypothetical protein